MNVFEESENVIRKRIAKRLKEGSRYYLYCSACSAYLCTFTRFIKYIVHIKCAHKVIKFYNSPDNPAPEPNYPRH